MSYVLATVRAVDLDNLRTAADAIYHNPTDLGTAIRAVLDNADRGPRVNPDPDRWHITFTREALNTTGSGRVVDQCVITDDSGEVLGGGTLVHHDHALRFPELDSTYRHRLVAIAARDIAQAHTRKVFP